MQILNMNEIDFCDWMREHWTGSEKVLRSQSRICNLPDIPPEHKAPEELRKKAVEPWPYRYKVDASGPVGGPDEVIEVYDTSSAKVVQSDKGILPEEEPWVLPCDKQENPIEWPWKGIPKIGLENVLILIPKKHEAILKMKKLDEAFVRNLRVWLENDSEINVQEEPGRKAVSYTFESIGLGRKSREFLLLIFEDPEHFCRISGSRDHNRQPSKLYHAHQQMLKAISQKFIIFFEKTFQRKSPQNFKCYEMVKSEKPGTYRFKFQMVDDTLSQKAEREIRELARSADLDDVMKSEIQRGKITDPLGSEDYPDQQD